VGGGEAKRLSTAEVPAHPRTRPSATSWNEGRRMAIDGTTGLSVFIRRT